MQHWVVSASIVFNNISVVSLWGSWQTFRARCQVWCSLVFLLVLWTTLPDTSPHCNSLLATSSSDTAAYFYRIFTLEEEKERALQGNKKKKKKKFLQFKTHFSIRQELYWRLSIVRCWQIPHIFHIRPPKTRRCFKTRGTSSTRDSGWPSEHEWKWTKYLFFLFFSFFIYSLWYKCNITSHKSFRNLFGNHLKSAFILRRGWGWGAHQ